MSQSQCQGRHRRCRHRGPSVQRSRSVGDQPATDSHRDGLVVRLIAVTTMKFEGGPKYDRCNDPLPSIAPSHHAALGALRRDQSEQRRRSQCPPFGGMLERETRQLLRLLGRNLAQDDVASRLTHRTGRCAAIGKACHHEGDCRTVACRQCGVDGANRLASRRTLGCHQHVDFGVVQGAQRAPVQGARVQAAALPVER